MTLARQILQRWEALDDLPGESRIAEARKDISFLVVELDLALKIIRQLAASQLPQHLWVAREEACAYLAERGESSIQQ